LRILICRYSLFSYLLFCSCHFGHLDKLGVLNVLNVLRLLTELVEVSLSK
jgi:hypothetical protein